MWMGQGWKGLGAKRELEEKERKVEKERRMKFRGDLWKEMGWKNGMG